MSDRTIGRNAPCGCGSGKKYKHCCSRPQRGADSASPEITLQAAVAHHQAGRLAQADFLYRQILRSDPDHQEALHFSGVLAQQMGKADTAAQLIIQAIETEPRSASGAMYCNLGNALQALGRVEAAITCYRRALSIDPASAETCNNLGNAHLAHGNLEAAITCYREAMARDPNHAEALCNLGNGLRLQGMPDAAADCYRQAIMLRPNHAAAHTHLGNVLHMQGELQAAIESHRRALAIDPGFAAAHVNEGLCRLLNGDFEGGLERYEWRFKASPRIRSDFGLPLWQGESLAGKSILLTAEQGYGDSLQFVRYASLVAQQAAQVILQVPKPLQRLLSSVAGVERVMSEGEALPQCDFSCPLLSLPHRFGTRLHTIPAGTPYLHADEGDIETWKARLTKDGTGSDLRVGLVWSGNARKESGDADLTSMDARRSIQLAQLSPLAHIERVRFYSLQLGEPSEQARSAPMPLIDHTHCIDDFADTAALISQLDLVISVDTSVAHLAGALGKPVWMLNRFDTCWRWLREREDSPWYPTMQIIRQERPGVWEPVVCEVARRLGASSPWQ